MDKKKLQNFISIEFYVFAFFLLAVLIINLVSNLLLRSFAVIVFFFIPGYLLLKSIKSNNPYNPIESIVYSFGLSLFLIIIIMYVLIKFNFIDLILFIYLILTTFLFVIVILKKIMISSFEFSNLTYSKSPLQILLSLWRKDKFTLIIGFFMILFFFLAFFLRNFNILRFPDEYYYLWASDRDILPNLSYRDFNFMEFHYIISSWLKLGFILTLSFYFNLVGTTAGIAPHILPLFYYSMLFPVTYLIGSLHNKKTGLIAALFIVCNPIIWFWNNRIMPDILYTVIVAACFYFFYKSLKKRGLIEWKYFVPAVIFALLSYTQQPKLIFTWGIPFLFYFLTTIKRRSTNNRRIFILILLFIVFLFSFLMIIFFFNPWLFQYDFSLLLKNLFSIFYFSFQDWIEFLSPGGTIWFCFSYPYYYSYAIIIMAILGSFCFAFKHTKRENILFFLSIGMTFYLHSTSYSEWGARFSFLIFPMLMVLAAIGFTTNIGRYSAFLIPILFFLFPLLFINEPGISQFPQIMDLPVIISKLVAISVIGYKVLEGFGPNLQRLSLKSFQILNNLKFRKLISAIMIFLVVSSSLRIGNSIVTNDKYWRNDYRTPEDFGLPQVGNWLITNVPTNSVVITNARAHILNYYTDFRFDIHSDDLRLNRQDVGTIITPSSEIEFLELIETRSFDYLVVFTESVIGEHWKRPYFYPFIVEGSLFTIYELVENHLEFNMSESTDSWYKTAGDLKISLDSIDKIGGNSSIKVDGTTDKDGKTIIYNCNMNGTWNLNFSIFSFWFKLVNATNPYYFSMVLTDILKNYRYWNNDMQVLNNWDSYTWQKILIPLNNYKNQIGAFNIEQVNNISFYLYTTPNTSITYHLDQFQAFQTLIKIFSL